MLAKRNPPGRSLASAGLTAVALLLSMTYIDESNSVFGAGWNRYEFITYPDTMQNSLDSLEFDLGSPRSHPGNYLRLTNKNGNLPLTDSELSALNSLPGVVIIGSDSIAAYLEENGWNEGGGE